MTDTLNLPELPAPLRDKHNIPLFGSDQMRAYATAAVLAERARAAGKIAKVLALSEQMDGYLNSPEQVALGEEIREALASAIRGSSPASQGEGE